ncbi:MAG: methyl-accepting chemotaxis protein [Pseudomonadota bacterium]
MKLLRDLSVAAKTYLISTIFIGGMLCIGITSTVLMNGVEHEMIEIAEEDVPLIRALTKVTVNSLEQAILLEKMLPAHDEASESKAYHADFTNRVENNHKAFTEALALTDRAEELAASEEAFSKLQEVGRKIADLRVEYDDYVQKAEAIFAKTDNGQKISNAERDEIEKIQKQIDHKVEEELFKIEAFAAEAAMRAEAHGQNVIWSIIILSVIASIVGMFACWLLVRAIARPLREMAGGITEMAEGNEVEIPCLGNGDELGVLARSLEAVLQKGLEAARLRQALDRCTTLMMVANRHNEIIYINPALYNHLKQHEVAIRADLPRFDCDSLIGSDIDVFHKNQADNHKVIEGLTTTHKITLTAGGRKLHLVINPVINPSGGRLGTVFEWHDQTEETAMRESIDQLVTAVQNGDFNQRIDLAEIGAEHLTAAEGMNAFAKVVDDATGEIGEILTALAKGDLTKRIKTDYKGRFGELKDDANRTADQLSAIVAQIQDATGELKTAASEINSGTEDLSKRTEQAAANLEETAASTEQMAATVRQNAENAKTASDLAGGADQNAKQGGQVVEKAVTAMAGIEESAQKITDIIGVIDEIAFQTNLLALNASVEAARAGEAGKGFAVVAQEVRQLAQRAAQAASDIKDLIQNSNGQVKDGVQLVNQAGQALTEIVGSIGKVAKIVQEISNASQEQAMGVQEINGSVSSMDEMTQQNSALVEESTAASRVLSQQAGTLGELIEFFKLDTSAYARQPQASAPAPAPAPTRPTPAAKKAPVVVAGDDEGWSEF